MTELETLIVPEELGVWLEDMDLGKSSRYFTMIDALFHYWDTAIDSPMGNFIAKNKKELIEVIIGSREYEAEEEQKYYVMNEENELILGWSQSAYMTPCIEGYEYMKYNGRENLFQLTEQEIKDYDERYWTFAEPVEQADFRLLF